MLLRVCLSPLIPLSFGFIQHVDPGKLFPVVSRMAEWRKIVSFRSALVISVLLNLHSLLWAPSLKKLQRTDAVQEVKRNDSLQEVNRSDSLQELEKLQRSDAFQEVKRNDSLQEVKRSDSVQGRSVVSSSVLHGYPPTLTTCDVTELSFDESRMFTAGAPMMFVPNHTIRIAYGPFLPKCGSTTMTNTLKYIGGNDPIKIDTDAIENNYTFVSLLRHPMERALSGISQIEVIYHLGWFNGVIEKFNLTWWNTSCINTTWGFPEKRPSCMGSLPSRSITARLKRLDAFLDDMESKGYPNWHVVPVTYLMSVSPVVQKAKNLLYFDVKDAIEVEKALCKSFNVTYKPVSKNDKPASHNPYDPHGLHWHIRWAELVEWADTNPLAQGVIERLCSLYHQDVECLPFEVPECLKDDSINNAKDISLLEEWRDNRIRELVNESNVIFWKNDELFIQKYFTSLIDRVDREKLKNADKVWKDASRDFVYESSVCKATKRFKETGQTKPHILFTNIGENWGAFSTYVPGRTVNWNDLNFNLKIGGCTIEDVFDYLNHKNTLAVFTTQHQEINHPKVHSVPLGVSDGASLMESLRRPRANRTQLLSINTSGWQHRKNISIAVLKNFRGTVNNTFGSTREEYYNEMKRSKFVLCPSGLGWDSYRIWETLYMGAIPIVELYGRDEDGWRRCLKDLPVLWVERFENVTPKLLKSKYNGIVKRAQTYKYEKLTTTWWVDFVESFRKAP